jgi:hypothetical protein
MVVLVLAGGCAFADDIVTMPTANQLKAGEVDAAVYHLSLDFPLGYPQSVEYQTLYVGITDWLEIDAHRADVDGDEDATVLVGSVKVLSETAVLPDVVVGCRNIGETATTKGPARKKSEDRSYFISTAKTVFVNPAAPGPPLYRVHLSYGSPDWTLLGDRRHDGFFGGLQLRFTPYLGAVVQHDGEDIIAGITIMPKNTGITIKAGSYGEHWWTGIALRKTLNF